MFTKDVYLILMHHCTHLEILKRIFKVVFLFSYQSSVLKEPCIHQCFFKFLSLPYRGDLIIISPHPGYVNNFFQLFSIFFNFNKINNLKTPSKRLYYWLQRDIPHIYFNVYFNVYFLAALYKTIFHLQLLLST